MQNNTYKVLEIFSSIDGEGRRAGELVTFIRFSGCSLRCSWCDTAYSQDGKEGIDITIDDILKKVYQFGNTNITVTGGEPLYQKNIDELFEILLLEGFDINVETNGNHDIDYYVSGDFKNRFTESRWEQVKEHLWFTMDYKSRSSGMRKFMRPERFLQLRDIDVLKFVVGSQDELTDSLEIIRFIRKNNINCYVYFSPVFGMIQSVEIVEFMKQHKEDMNKVRVQLQLHKIIWDPNKREV